MLQILTSNQLFFFDAFFLCIVLFLLLLAHIRVLLNTLLFLNIQFCQITFVSFLCTIAKLYESLSGSSRLSLARKQTQKVSGLRLEPTMQVWQTFRLFAGFCCIFPFTQIHFHAFLQMRLQQYARSYLAPYTQGSAASVESSGKQTRQPTSIRT